MSVREIFGCFACRVPGGTDEPHRDFDLVAPHRQRNHPAQTTQPTQASGVGYVHERCRLPNDGLDKYPLCTLTDDQHYPVLSSGPGRLMSTKDIPRDRY